MSGPQENGPEQLVGVIDASTRTVKFSVFVCQHIKEIAEHAIDLEPITPQEGWSEQDPLKILDAVKKCMEQAVNELGPKRSQNIVTIGITNQRETTIVWDKTTGKPLYNAIVFSIVTECVNPKAECVDPNAELRYDNPFCVLTCNKRSIFENPGFCFRRTTLLESCYCKQGFYFDEITRKCVESQNCPCNATNNEISVFNNECGAYCGTFHTLEPCPILLRGQCWCKSIYCRAEDGTCILKEEAHMYGF